MGKNKIVSWSLVDACGTLIYITLIDLFFNNAKYIFPHDNSFFIPIAILTLFVLSAAITGSLVLGRPVLMYLDGHKKEAVQLFLYTLAWFALFLLLFLPVAYFVQNI